MRFPANAGAAAMSHPAVVVAEDSTQPPDPLEGAPQSTGEEGQNVDAKEFDCYAILGVEKGAKPEQLKRQYRKRALAMHPDKGGSTADFAKLCKAFNILSDSAKRNAFDMGGMAAVAILEDASLRCRLEAHFGDAIKKTLAAAGLIFLDAEVLHPRFSVIQKTRKMLRRSGAGGFTPSDGQPPTRQKTKIDFHLYTASPIRIHASLVKQYPFVREFWPTPATFSPTIVGNLSLQAHSMLAAVEVAPKSGFINIEIAQRTLENSAEGKVIGLACPICGEHFEEGRPLRMHLQSPRHGLDHWALREAIQAAQRKLVFCPLEGVTGRTKAMAAAAREEQRRRNEEAAASWDGTAVGHGSGSGTYKETDEGLLAARHGNLERLQQLVEAGWDPCASVDALGSCALHWAAGNGHLECCQFLVDKAQVDPSVRCTQGRADGRHALHWASRNGHIDVMEWLVSKHGLDVNDPTFDGTTPFHWAVWRGEVEAAAWLARRGANTTARNRYGCNGSHWAALSGDMRMLMFLDKLWSFDLVPAMDAIVDNEMPTTPDQHEETVGSKWALSPQCMDWLGQVEDGLLKADADHGSENTNAQHDEALQSQPSNQLLISSFGYSSRRHANPFRVANTQGHTPLSKGAYAGKRHVCEFFLGICAADTEGFNVDSEAPQQNFAQLRVPLSDLLCADGNGFRPADIARCAGFERLGDWLDKLSKTEGPKRDSTVNSGSITSNPEP